MKQKLFTFALVLLVAGSAWAQQSISLQNGISDKQNPHVKELLEKTRQGEKLIRPTDMPVSLRADEAETLVFTIGDLTYSVTDGANHEATITGCTETATIVTIPATVSYNSVEYSVTGVAELAFTNCSALTTIDVVPENAYYSSQDGVLFNKDKTVLIQYPRAKAGNSYTIPNSVDSIGYASFYECSALTQVTIPNSVKSIGEWAFAVSALTQVTIPSSVTSIGTGAFQECPELAEVTLNCPNVGKQMFALDSKLTTVNLQDGVTGIGDYAFYGCSAFTEIIFPENLASIGNYAFYECQALTGIVIPDGVTSIGNSAFESCHALTHVSIPNNVTSIGYGIFYNCDKLERITIGNGITSIEDDTFYGCSALTQVTIPESVTSIGSWAFAHCSALTQVNIPNSVTSIGYYAFCNCSALTQVNIPNSVTSIGEDAFYNTALYNNTNNWTNDVLYIDNCLIKAKYELSGNYEITAGTRIIANNAFSWCSALTQVTIPGSVENIGDYTFNSCSALAKITVLPTIPPTITANTFNNISTQVKVSVPEGSRNAYMADKNWKQLLDLSAGLVSGICGDNLTWTFTTADSTLTISGIGDMYDYGYSDQPWYNFNQGIKNISMPEGLTSIGDYAFYRCSAFTQVTIGSGVTSIGDEAFNYCSALTAINVKSGNTAYCSENGILFNKDKTLLITYPAGKQESAYIIPDGVKTIGDFAFHNCSALTQVTIGNSVKSIGYGAFAQCYALTEITIPDSVTSIGDYAFYNCFALTQVTIGNSVTSIGNYAFYWCFALKEMTVLAAVPPTVGWDAFYNVSRDIPVYVPAEALDAYQVADTWKEFNLQAMQTALHTPSMPESISVYGGLLHNPQGLPVSIYDMQGRMVYSGTATTVSRPAGVYVVLCAGASRKVLF